MFQHQLEASVATGVGCLASLTLLLCSKGRHLGYQELPRYKDGYGGYDGEESDAFNMDSSEDMRDGYPLTLDAFWAEVKWRKLLVAWLLGGIFIIDLALLLWTLLNNSLQEGFLPGLDSLASFYLLALPIHSGRKRCVSAHAQHTLHHCALTALHSAGMGLASLLPEPRVFARYNPYNAAIPAFTTFWYIKLSIYVMVFLIVLTMRLGPRLYFPLESVYHGHVVEDKQDLPEGNVCEVTGCSIGGFLFFSWTTRVVMAGHAGKRLQVSDLPLLPAIMRAKYNYVAMKRSVDRLFLSKSKASRRSGSGWGLGILLLKLNLRVVLVLFLLGLAVVLVSYAPAVFLNGLVKYLEEDPSRNDTRRGWFHVLGLFLTSALESLMKDHMYSISTVDLEVRLRIQLNSTLFKKTLACKRASNNEGQPDNETDSESRQDAKAQIMTLMSTDVDRLSKFIWHLYMLIASPLEIVIASYILYRVLGVSCLVGIGVSCILLPLNHFAGKYALAAQGNLLKARDERVALMNEVLGAMRMLKFMAWERKFEERILSIREKELKYQKTNYSIETLWRVVWYSAPVIVSVFTFWHFTNVRHQALTSSIAFTAILVFGKMKYALNGLPGALIGLLESFVSLRRIERYLNRREVDSPRNTSRTEVVGFRACTLTWSHEHPITEGSRQESLPFSSGFALSNLNLSFPTGELSLICGKLGSGKTLALLGLLGEADVVSGEVYCPRSPPDTIGLDSGGHIPPAIWIMEGVCAYVPQVAWLSNASIKDNILFHLPYDEDRYLQTLEACALVNDLEILEDGDETEIGARGVNLSGGQKVRVSLARAVYSRAAVLLLDDVLSAVDAHTAFHLFHRCIRGEIMAGRTVILVSHHVRLCAPGARYIVALTSGHIGFEGDYESFKSSSIITDLVDGLPCSPSEETLLDADSDTLCIVPTSGTSSAASSISGVTVKGRGPPKKLVEEEKRTVGHIGKDAWKTYTSACGGPFFWFTLVLVLLGASTSPVLENGWLKRWSNEAMQRQPRDSTFYVMVYAAFTFGGLIIAATRWFFLYSGTLRASDALYRRLLKAVLFANMRFHDTVSRGRLLNRFGKDFEDIDSSLPDDVVHAIIYALSALTTVVTVSFVGGLPFIVAIAILSVLYFKVAQIYGHSARDMRRLCSVTRSPLYSTYGETIAGATVIRAFGASSKTLHDMLQLMDMQSTPYYWMWAVNRWLARRFNMFSDSIVGAVALLSLLTPTISASLAGFALAFASTITSDMLFLAWRFVGLEQAMVAVERVKEYSDLPPEGSEHTKRVLPIYWPENGVIECKDLSIRYASYLPDVLHKIDFTIKAGEKIGVVGRTGSGKSTLALSLFRFVERMEGTITIDGIDITELGLSDLRSRLTIIPQDPTILSGSLRSTLDVFGEYQDDEIYEALRRVHLIPSNNLEGGTSSPEVDLNIFRNLDSIVSEGGENFSTGQKQLLCVARAILKRTKILVMDEATASVDYATDELISTTIRQEFAESTILTIAHRLRTIIDYDRVMVLDQGRIVEFDRPSILLQDENSGFYGMCRATGQQEFMDLKRMAEVSER